MDQEIYVTWLARLFPPQGKWRADDYFSLPDSNQIIELSDGEITMAPPPIPEHQRAVKKLAFHLDQFVEHNKLGEVFIAPLAVRLRENKIREPDIFFIRTEHADRVGRQYVDGAPDWVAEVISPSTREVDEEEKMLDYAQAGVPEYWLLDAEDKSIRVYLLQGDSYILRKTYRLGEIARSETIPGFEVPVDEMFRR